MSAFHVSKKKLLSKNGKKTAAGCGSLFPLCKMNNEKAWASPPRSVCGCFYYEVCSITRTSWFGKGMGWGSVKGMAFTKRYKVFPGTLKKY